MCDAEGLDVGGRIHTAHGSEVELSLHDRTREPGGYDYTQYVAPFIHQHISAVGPTLRLSSETVGISAEAGSGFELCMTREEFITLRAEMGRMIEATA
jgi:hypothetical protein